MGEIVNPGSLSYATEGPAITPTDGQNNLRMDGVAYKYLQNQSTATATVKIRTYAGSVVLAIVPGESAMIPHNALGVESTGSSNAGSLRALL
jgi:hypothetical protein